MKVSGSGLRSVDLTNHANHFMADGKTCDAVKTHVLCRQTDSGEEGWCEVCPIPHLLKVCAAVGANPLAYGDWNCGATKLHATRTGRAAAHPDIMLEQPSKTLEDCAAFRQTTVVTAAALLNTCDLSSYVGPRIAADFPVRQNGRIARPQGLGLGVTPDRGTLGIPILELD